MKTDKMNAVKMRSDSHFQFRTRNILAKIIAAIAFAAVISPVFSQQIGIVPIKVNTAATVNVFDQEEINVGSATLAANVEKNLEVDLGETTSIRDKVLSAKPYLSRQGGRLQLYLPAGNYENAWISLINIHGKTLKSVRLAGGMQADLLAGNITAGVYFIAVKSIGNASFVQKISHSGGKLSISAGTASTQERTALLRSSGSGDLYTIRITPDDNTNYADSAYTMTINTGANPAQNITLRTLTSPSNPSAAIQSNPVSIAATKANDLGNGAVEAEASVTINLANAVVNSAISADAKTWFSTIVAGLTYTASATANANSITIAITGIPEAISNAAATIAIPANTIKDSQGTLRTTPLSVSGSIVYNIDEADENALPTPSAAIQSSPVNVTATKANFNGDDEVAANAEVTINLTNASVNNVLSSEDVKAWFSTIVEGLTYTANAVADATAVTITIAGTPTAVSTANATISIPEGAVKNTEGEPTTAVLTVSGSISYNIGQAAIPATAMAFDEWINSNIATADDEQWFSMAVSEAGTYFIHFNPIVLEDIYVQVYDNAGNAVEGEANLYGSALSTSRTLSAGTYYLKVRPYAYSPFGDYQIGFNNIALGIGADWPPEATAMTVNTWANGTMPSENAEQWFSINAEGEHFIHFEPSDDVTWVYVQAYDNAGNTVGSRTNLSGNTRFTSRTFPAGTSYIKVEQDVGTGSYRLGVTNSVVPPGSSAPTALVFDEYGDGNLTAGGQSWFSFNATEAYTSHYIHFEYDGLTDQNIRIQVYNSTGETMGGEHYISSSNLSGQFTPTSTGTHYFRVRSTNTSATGTFKIAVNNSALPPGTVWPPSATALTAGNWEDGNIADASTEEWFKFTATEASHIIYFDPAQGSWLSVAVSVFDNNGLQAGISYMSESTKSYQVNNLTATQDYYIKVASGGNTGTYRILFNTTDAPVPFTPGAAVSSSVSISGRTANSDDTGAAVSDGSFYINLANARVIGRLQSEDVSAWVSPTVEGLSYTATTNYDNADQISFSVTGTPTETSYSAITITIPGNVLNDVGGNPITTGVAVSGSIAYNIAPGWEYFVEVNDVPYLGTIQMAIATAPNGAFINVLKDIVMDGTVKIGVEGSMVDRSITIKAKDANRTIRPASGFTGPFFSVADRGSLSMGNVGVGSHTPTLILDGEKQVETLVRVHGYLNNFYLYTGAEIRNAAQNGVSVARSGGANNNSSAWFYMHGGVIAGCGTGVSVTGNTSYQPETGFNLQGGIVYGSDGSANANTYSLSVATAGYTSIGILGDWATYKINGNHEGQLGTAP